MGVCDGQGSLACWGPWGHKESDTTERLNWTELNWSQLCRDIRQNESLVLASVTGSFNGKPWPLAMLSLYPYLGQGLSLSYCSSIQFFNPRIQYLISPSLSCKEIIKMEEVNNSQESFLPQFQTQAINYNRF